MEKSAPATTQGTPKHERNSQLPEEEDKVRHNSWAERIKRWIQRPRHILKKPKPSWRKLRRRFRNPPKSAATSTLVINDTPTDVTNLTAMTYSKAKTHHVHKPLGNSSPEPVTRDSLEKGYETASDTFSRETNHFNRNVQAVYSGLYSEQKSELRALFDTGTVDDFITADGLDQLNILDDSNVTYYPEPKNVAVSWEARPVQAVGDVKLRIACALNTIGKPGTLLYQDQKTNISLDLKSRHFILNFHILAPPKGSFYDWELLFGRKTIIANDWMRMSNGFYPSIRSPPPKTAKDNELRLAQQRQAEAQALRAKLEHLDQQRNSSSDGKLNLSNTSASTTAPNTSASSIRSKS